MKIQVQKDDIKKMNLEVGPQDSVPRSDLEIGFSKKIIVKFSAFVFATFILSLPFIVFAECPTPDKMGLIPCTGTSECPCDRNAIVKGVQGIITFLIKIAIPIATLSFAYAGFLYLTSGANPDQRSKAKKVFWGVGIGFVIILSAWAIVYFILTNFIDPSFIKKEDLPLK